ncbi:MAG TPA: hypothetical protein VIM38_10850 [Alphaproteobacteria bacterium]
MKYLMFALLAVAALIAPAQAADFYKGKTLTLLINYPPGGPTDIEGRVIARHLAEQIPGKPTVIVKNMGGAAGNTGANFLGEIAAKDGLTLGFFTWNPVDQILGAEGLRVKYNDFVFIAGVQQPTITYARKDTPPGLTKGADIMKTQNVKVGALSVTSTQALNSAIGLDLLGVKYNLIHGYKGLKEVETAALQGEVQLVNTSLPGYRASIEPNMVKPGIVVPLWHHDVEDANGNLAASPVIPEVPTYLQVYKEAKGGAPSGVKWDTLRLTNKIMNSMFRTSFLPPGSPKEATEELRAAYRALWKNEAFMTEYEKTVKYRAGLIVGADGEKLIASLGQVKPELVAFLKDYTAAIAK